MENPVETTPDAKMDWVAPELKKVDLEEITAAGTTVAGEGFSFS
jgi:hypothetical protein